MGTCRGGWGKRAAAEIDVRLTVKRFTRKAHPREERTGGAPLAATEEGF